MRVRRHAPAALPPGKTRYLQHSMLGGPQGRPGQVRKISPHTGIRSPDRPARSQSLYRLRYRAHRKGRDGCYDLEYYFVGTFLIFLTLKTTCLLAHFFLLVKNAWRHAQRKQNTVVQWNLNQIRSTSGHKIVIIRVLFIHQLMHY